jgi:D-3-phosphoglycerate dehydrogenase / 2-oxoglutarate reductase
MTLRVLCHHGIIAPLSAKLNSQCDIIAFDYYDEQSISRLIPDCDVLVSWLATKKIIEKAKNLKLIQCWGVGVNQIDLAFAHQHGIKVSNLAGFNSGSVADYTLSAILVLTTRLHAFDREMRQGSGKLSFRAINRLFQNNSYGFPIGSTFDFKDLSEKVLTIVGYGSIGQQIAVRAKAFGMRIMAIKRNPLNFVDSKIEFIGTLNKLHKVLQDSDFVSINLPLTKETRGIFGADEFSVMKPTAYLINSCRAEVLDNKALLSALKNRSIAGAVLDVFDESLKKSFLKLNNVILTPHISGDSEESRTRGIEVTAENISRLINGQPLLNVISPDKMY